MNTKARVYTPGETAQVKPNGEQPAIGYIGGSARVRVPMIGTPVKYGAGSIADVYADYVHKQVSALVEKYGQAPSEITVSFELHGDKDA